MEEKPQILVVPWDFSTIAENALKYALKIAALTPNFRIDLIHVLESGGIFSKSRMSESEAHEKLKNDAARIKSEYGYEVKTVALEGKIFHTISDYAFDIEASLVVMGTHGIKGVQKLTGSWALKVIAGSNVPFLVVQDQPTSKRIFENVVMPLDFKFEEKEKLQWAIKVSQDYNSNIHIILPHIADRGIQKKISYNLAYAKKHLESNNITYEIHSSARGRTFGDEVVKLAKDIESDLILIMTTPNLDFTDYVFGAQEQYIIANHEKIAVMCINPAMV